MTGGESLLAWQKLHIELFQHPGMRDLKMLHLKQTLHNLTRRFSTTIPRLRQICSRPWSKKKKKKKKKKNLVLVENWDTAILSDVFREYSPVNGSDPSQVCCLY